MFKTVLIACAAMVGAAYFASDAIRASLTQPKPPATAVNAGKAASAASDTVTLRAGPDGHFRVDAMVGGKRVPMLVDTGATVVALSYELGDSLGLVSGGDRFDSGVQTANGSVGAKRVTLRDVRIGGVKLNDVDAVVLSRGAMDGALLGMSFLGRLSRLETSRDKLVMER